MSVRVHPRQVQPSVRLASLQVPARAAYVSSAGTKFSGTEAPEDTVFLAFKKASAEVPADWRHAVMQRTLATLGAGALATALGVGAAGDAGAPFASTGVSDSPEPEEAGAAGVAAAGESVLEESEAPALTTAALISILTSVASYCASCVMTLRLGSKRVQFHCLQGGNMTWRCRLRLHTSHSAQATWTWTARGQHQSLWAGLMTPLPRCQHWCQPACRLTQHGRCFTCKYLNQAE